jgi:cytidylate kinase
MPLLFLIGRHGAGKSAIGRELANLGFQHWSIGLLRRLAATKSFPSDVPAKLIVALGRERPGRPVSSETATLLIQLASVRDNVVIDGFPSAPDHLDLLPPGSIVVYVSAPAAMRRARLKTRAAETLRQWENRTELSGRDASLSQVVCRLRKAGKIRFVSNIGALAIAVSSIAAAAAICTKPK